MSKTATNFKNVPNHKTYALCAIYKSLYYISDPCYSLRAQNSCLKLCQSINRALFGKTTKECRINFYAEI